MVPYFNQFHGSYVTAWNFSSSELDDGLATWTFDVSGASSILKTRDAIETRVVAVGTLESETVIVWKEFCDFFYSCGGWFLGIVPHSRPPQREDP